MGRPASERLYHGRRGARPRVSLELRHSDWCLFPLLDSLQARVRQPFDFGDRDTTMSVKLKSDRHKKTFVGGRVHSSYRRSGEAASELEERKRSNEAEEKRQAELKRQAEIEAQKRQKERGSSVPHGNQAPEIRAGRSLRNWQRPTMRWLWLLWDLSGRAVGLSISSASVALSSALYDLGASG